MERKWKVFALVAALATTAVAQVQISATGLLSVSEGGGGLVFSDTANPPQDYVAQMNYVGSNSLVLFGNSATFISDVNGASPGCPGFCYAESSTNVTLSFGSAVPEAGVLRLSFNDQIGYGGIDVGDDGVFEVLGGGPVVKDVPAVLTSTALPIRVFSEGGVGLELMQVEWIPAPQNLGLIEPGCGPTLGAFLDGDAGGDRNLTMWLTSSVNFVTVLQLGTAPAQTPGVCGPATLPDATLYFFLPAPGSLIEVPISASLTGSFTLQAVDVTPSFAIVWGHGVTLSLP